MAGLLSSGRAIFNLVDSVAISLQNAVQELIPIIRILWWLLEQSAWSARMARAFPLVEPISDTDAIQNLERDLNRAQKKRQDDKKEDNKSVLKLNDAMEAVMKHIGVGTTLVQYVKAVVRGIAHGSSEDFATRLYNQIREDMLEKVLRQDTSRVAHRETKHGRPARGHGHGRSSF